MCSPEILWSDGSTRKETFSTVAQMYGDQVFPDRQFDVDHLFPFNTSKRNSLVFFIVIM